MTLKQMIEFVQQHHPKQSPNVIRMWLNERRRELAHRAGLERDYATITTSAGVAVYSMPTGVIDVHRVDFDGERIERLPGEPPYIDDTVVGTGVVPGP